MPKIKASPIILGRTYFTSSGRYVGKLVGIMGSVLTFQRSEDQPLEQYLNTGSFRMVHTLEDEPTVAFNEGAV